MSGELVICRENSKYGIILSGRVNFETVVPLRDFVNDLPTDVEELTIDMANCLSMDSTCMGVLSMLALTGIKRKLKLQLLNAGSNRQLLKGLGVEKLFKFADMPFEQYAEVLYPAADARTQDLKSTTETVLEAHQTLIAADDSNKERFDSVVEMTKQDLDRFNESN